MNTWKLLLSMPFWREHSDPRLRCFLAKSYIVQDRWFHLGRRPRAQLQRTLLPSLGPANPLLGDDWIVKTKVVSVTPSKSWMSGTGAPPRHSYSVCGWRISVVVSAYSGPMVLPGPGSVLMSAADNYQTRSWTIPENLRRVIRCRLQAGDPCGNCSGSMTKRGGSSIPVAYQEAALKGDLWT